MGIKPYQFTTRRMLHATTWLAVSLALAAVGGRIPIAYSPDANYPLACQLLCGALATFCIAVAVLCGRTSIGIWVAFLVMLVGPAYVFLVL